MGGAGSLPRSPSLLWLAAEFISVQFLIPNKSKSSSGSCYAITLFCTKYTLLLVAGVCTPRLLLHAVCSRLSSEQGGLLIRFLENACNWVLLVCFSCQYRAHKVLMLFTTLSISSVAECGFFSPPLFSKLPFNPVKWLILASCQMFCSYCLCIFKLVCKPTGICFLGFVSALPLPKIGAIPCQNECHSFMQSTGDAKLI